uniref:Solute carrier family 46 member 3 n=1 Tax=Sinocyclocheilus grahami TaxID=75366 RepID=A0A672QZG4_SINGR
MYTVLCSDLKGFFLLLSLAVQKETSIFLLESELCFLIPSLISALLLVSYSDHCGCKVAIVPPLVGDTLFALCYVLVSRFSFSLSYLLAASFLSGLMGGPTTLIGVLTGLASLCTGFYIEAAGFTWPFLTAVFLHLINLFYVLVVLKESLVLPNPSLSSPGPSAAEAPRLHQSQARLQGVYLLFPASKRRRDVVLLLMLAAFVALQGGMSIFILYELNTPLCWSEVLVDYGLAFSTAIYLVSFASVALLSRCLSDAYHPAGADVWWLVGLFSGKTIVYVLFIAVRLPLLLSIMPTPVLQSMMSKIVSGSAQGKNLNRIEKNRINFHLICYSFLFIPSKQILVFPKNRTFPIHMNSELLMAVL